MQTEKQKDFAAGLRTWERPRAGLSKCGASVFYEPCDAEARAHFWGQVAEVKGKRKLGPGASAAADAAVAACAGALLPLTACRQLPIQRAQRALGLNSMNKTRQDKTCKAGSRGRGNCCCCCCCLCALTGPVGQLPQTDNHYNQVNKMMIIVSSSASTAAAAQHVALFIFSDLFEDFLWVVCSLCSASPPSYGPQGSAFSTRCAYAYVCFFIFYLYGHYEFRAEQSRRITIKRRGKLYLFICSLNLNCALCQLSLEILGVVIVAAIIVMLFVAVVVFGLNAAEHI